MHIYLHIHVHTSVPSEVTTLSTCFQTKKKIPGMHFNSFFFFSLHIKNVANVALSVPVYQVSSKSDISSLFSVVIYTSTTAF